MIRVLLISCLAVGLLGQGSALADDAAYTLKLYKPKKGDKIEFEKTEESKNKVAISLAGMNNNQEILAGKKEAYIEEILEKKIGDQKPTRLTRTYSTSEKIEGKKSAKSVLAGKTVLIEKKGEKFQFSIDGKEVDEKDAADLSKSFNKPADAPDNEDMLPAEAVNVGGTWKVSADKAERMFKSLGEKKMKADAQNSTIGGKLLKAYKKDGAQFGVIELTITLFVTEIDLGGNFTKTKDGSKVVVKLTIDTCIDGTVHSEESKLEGTSDLSLDLLNNGSLVIHGTMSGLEKSRAAKK